MIEVALIGFGVVGQGTAALLSENAKTISDKIGDEIHIKYILDLRDMPESPFADRIIHDYNVIVNDPEVKIVAEMIGGSHPAFEFSMQALEAGKSVVTSNKEVVANFGDKLLAKAKEMGVHYLFEASVGGGIPVLRPLKDDLAVNRIREITGILNGTTNYILTEMAEKGTDFATALAEAQRLGYAEANPTADIDGIDACRKIVILSAIASGKLVSPDCVHTESISTVRSADMAAARAAGYSIKLLGRYLVTTAEDTFITVSPFLVPNDSPLYSVNDVFNAVVIDGNFVGRVMFYGRGAGAAPTASAVCSDIYAIASGNASLASQKVWTPVTADAIADYADFAAPRYLAVTGAEPTAIRVIFGDGCRILSEDTNGEVLFLTPSVSGRALSEDIERLTACGGRVVSSFPVYR